MMLEYWHPQIRSFSVYVYGLLYIMRSSIIIIATIDKFFACFLSNERPYFYITIIIPFFLLFDVINVYVFSEMPIVSMMMYVFGLNQK